MPQLEIHFEGVHAEAEAQELARLLGQEMPEFPARIVPRAGGSGREGSRDPAIYIAIVALVFASIGATKNALDLADRFKLQQKLDRLVAWAKARRARRQPNPFAVLPPHGIQVPLDQVKSEQLVQALLGPDGKEPDKQRNP